MRKLTALALFMSLAACGSNHSEPSEPSTGHPKPVTRTNLFLCQSPVQSNGKYARTYVEIYSDFTRIYHTEIYLENGMTDNFDVTEKAPAAFVETNVMHGILEDIKGAYGLGPDTNYQLKFNGERLDINVVGDVNPHSFGALGIPTAPCVENTLID